MKNNNNNNMENLLTEARDILLYRRELIDLQQDIVHDSLVRTQEKLLDAILNSKMCKKCKLHYETNGAGCYNVEHHPPIIVESTTAKNTSMSEYSFLDQKVPVRKCRYVLYQYWLDFLSRHRSELVESNLPFKAQLQIVLLSLRDNECCVPPFDWHYFQFFREPLNKNAEPINSRNNNNKRSEPQHNNSNKGNHGMKVYEFCRDMQNREDELTERQVQRQTYTWSTNPLLLENSENTKEDAESDMGDDDSDSSVIIISSPDSSSHSESSSSSGLLLSPLSAAIEENEKEKELRKKREPEDDFLEFIGYFLISEYGEASDVHRMPISMATRVSEDLCLDELGRCVLYAWMDDKYFFENRYRTLSLKEFDAATTLYDLFKLTQKK